MNPRRRRQLAAIGLLVPAVALLFVSVYVLLGGAGTQQCTYPGGSPARSSCTTDPIGAVLVTFPAGIVCALLCAAVFRGARWARWPSVVVGALLGTVTAAGGLAVLVALASDGQVLGAVLLGLGGAVLVVVCALPAIVLAPPEGDQALDGDGPAPRASAS